MIGNSNRRRQNNGISNPISGNSSKDNAHVAANHTSAVTTSNASPIDGSGVISFSTLPTKTLSLYRQSHLLSTPSSFSSDFTQRLLTRPNGIGRFSPTMVAAATTTSPSSSSANGAGVRKNPQNASGKERLRVKQSKEALAEAIRRDFNNQGVDEMAALGGFLYSAEKRDKAFRARFQNGGPPATAQGR